MKSKVLIAKLVHAFKCERPKSQLTTWNLQSCSSNGLFFVSSLVFCLGSNFLLLRTYEKAGKERFNCHPIGYSDVLSLVNKSARLVNNKECELSINQDDLLLLYFLNFLVRMIVLFFNLKAASESLKFHFWLGHGLYEGKDSTSWSSVNIFDQLFQYVIVGFFTWSALTLHLY